MIIPLVFRGRCKPSCEAVRQILTMWGEVPPGVSSFHPPSPSSSFLSVSLSFSFFLFFISYERQSLLPNTEAPQELIIQKTRAPRRTGRTSETGGRRRAERDGAKTRACVKVGRGCLHTCVCVCVLFFPHC